MGLRELFAYGEPFRVLFPIGALLAVVGVLLWPLFALGWYGEYPAVAHARVMIQGFLSAFVFGFLGTALPRLLEVPKVGFRPTLLLAGGVLLVAGLQLGGLTLVGDIVYLGLLVGFLGAVGWRFRQRRDTPPPGFVLVGLGMMSALVGTVLLILDGFRVDGLPLAWYRLAGLLAWQGYLLLPVLGIGAFLLPRFFGLPNRHAFPELMMPTPEWRRRAWFAGAAGGLILFSMVLEAIGWIRTGSLLRALVFVVYVLREVPIHRSVEATGTLATGLRLSLLGFPVGYLLCAIFPELRLGYLHIVMITGFGLITFVVGARVMLGHSGQSATFRRFQPWLAAMIILLIGSLLMRLWADADAGERLTRYGWSGALWVFAILCWSVRNIPRVRYPDDEE